MKPNSFPCMCDQLVQPPCAHCHARKVLAPEIAALLTEAEELLHEAHHEGVSDGHPLSSRAMSGWAEIKGQFAALKEKWK